MPYPFRELDAGIHYVEVPSLSISNPMFVLGAPGRAILVDCSTASTAAEAIATLEGAGYGPGSLQAIAITHGHLDHFGGASALAQWSGAPVWAHPAAIPQMEDPWGGFVSPDCWIPNTTPADWQAYRALAGEPIRVERLLREGDTLETDGMRFTVLHGPGHERGSIVLFEEHRRVACTGDIIQGGMDASANWLGLVADVGRQRATLARLKALRPAWVLKGHRMPRGGADVAADLDCAMARVDRLESSVRASLARERPLSVAAATRAAFRDVLGMETDATPNYAAGTVTAVLRELSLRGLARILPEQRWEGV